MTARPHIPTVIAIAVLSISVSSIAGIMLDERALMTWGSGPPISMPAAVCLLLLSIHELFRDIECK
jgi:hypothetical protein